MKKVIATAVSALALLAAASCTSPTVKVATDESPRPAAKVGQSTEPAKATSNPKAQPADEAARRFVEAMASNDAEKMRAALAHTVKGSVAWAYLEHQANLEEAALDAGFGEVEPDAVDGLKSCYESNKCTTFGGFVADKSGKLTDLTVDGKPIKGRLTVGNGKVVTTKGGHKFEFLTAYKAVTSDWLFVTIRVTSGDQPLNLDLYDAPYRAPNGKVRKPEPDSVTGPTDDVEPESNTIVSVAYPAATPGGRVTFTGCVDDCNDEYKAVVKIG